LDAKPAGAVPPGPVNSAASAAVCTVYVGRISAEVSDDFVKMLLEKCGKVAKWNRAADPNTSKLTSFGFCDFEEPQGVWRALQFLHEKQLCDKRLLVKCEDKAKHTIEVWKVSRREDLAKKRASGGSDKDESKDEEAKDGEKPEEKETAEEKDAEKEKEKEKAKEGTGSKPEPLTEEQLEEELQKESKEVSDEITRLMAEKSKNFPELKDGDVPAKDEEKAEDKAKAEKDREPEAPPKTDEKPEKPVEKDGERDGDKRDAEKPRDRSREDRGRRGASRENRGRDDGKRKDDDRDEKRRNAVSRQYRPSRRERERDTRVRERERDIEKEYEYRIREFERSEDKRIRAFKADLRDMEPLPELSDREKRKLIDRDLKFGDRDSDERDWKRHREDRANERMREKEKDAADAAARQKELEEEKQKEEQELEEERRKKEEEEKKKKEEEEEKQRQERLAEEEVKRKKIEEEQKVKDAEMKKQQEAAAAKLLQSVQESLADKKTVPLSMPNQEAKVASAPAPAPVAPPVAAPKSDAPEPKLKDEEMRRLIHQVPTDKAKAFAYDIDWKCVDDHDILEKKLRPWVKKKVTEYLGQEEQGMIDFIMRKVKSQTSPQKILDELEGFLDEEAENFTLKMWRMLIFEVLRVKAR